MSDCGCEIEVTAKEQKGVSISLLFIIAFMFVFAISIGWYAQSTRLIADSIDMLADAIVYGIGLYAIGRSMQHKHSLHERHLNYFFLWKYYFHLKSCFLGS